MQRPLLISSHNTFEFKVLVTLVIIPWAVFFLASKEGIWVF